ncbi:putative purple acid phosphatase 20 [Dendrobium catenatum]|uniref:Putative purple acid phosphatase 20 n=1 Tax=Dendrobium catenatum TaxID=906689 RepID=A0A2I0WGK6_9ASPA|nr:putative purple acid phosphatase 20 [Dendrobium catenatum]
MASHLLPTLLLLLALAVSWSATGSGATSPYLCPPPRETLSTPLADDADSTTPSSDGGLQVAGGNVRLVEHEIYIDFHFSALYTSGKIHEAVIGSLDPYSVYYYRCSGNPAQEFSFKTPPAVQRPNVKARKQSVIRSDKTGSIINQMGSTPLGPTLTALLVRLM